MLENLHRLLRRFALSLLALGIGFISGTGSSPASSQRAQQSAQHVCGPIAAAPVLREPPDIDVWTLPRDARGERELILAVHQDGMRFCYSYTAAGAVHTGAPTIRVRRGEHFALRIVNDISSPSAGSRVASSAITKCFPKPMPANVPVLHYSGYLNHVIDDRYMRMKPIDTNIHLHGFEGPAGEEDVFLSTLSTPMHACEYDITIPKTQPPGTYFYHPHVHGMSETEVIGGLAGTWIVEPDSDPIPRGWEHVIVLRYALPLRSDNPFAPDDSAIGVDAAAHEGALRLAPPVAYNQFAPPPWPTTNPIRAGAIVEPVHCQGLAGEPLMTVDGAQAPASLEVAGGRAQLLRIVNATSDSAKFLQLHDSSGAPVELHVVGLDGVPVSGNARRPLSRYLAMKRWPLAPSARMDILVTVPRGKTLVLSSEHFCSGFAFQMHRDLLRIHGMSASARPAPDIASSPASIARTSAGRLVAFARTHPKLIRRRAITFSQYAFPRRGKIPAHSAYFITDTTNPRFHEHPFWPTYSARASAPSNPDIVVKHGTIEEWYLINTAPEVHAFHIHQMKFVEERSAAGMPVSVDVAFLPIGKFLPNPRDPNYPLVKPSITKVLLDFRDVPRGTFVFHCHMLFHEDHGMMGVIRVE